MQYICKYIVIAGLVGGAVPAGAVQLHATSATLKSVFAAAKSGDNIRLTGNFGAQALQARSFTGRVTIDATRATFTDTLTIRDVTNLDFVGGRFGSTTSTYQNGGTIRVTGGSGVRFLRPTIVGDGLGKAHGIGFSDTTRFTVDRGTFEGLRLAIGVGNSTRGLISNNRITKATSDGINISSSQIVTARNNHCSNTIISLGAHPDCIQLWSRIGEPIQSDIKLLDNEAHGYTQGFTSFDPGDASGLRIEISGNIVATSLPQGIACYGCFDSLVTRNTLTTLPGANHRTTIRVIGGADNIVTANSVAPYTKAPALGGRLAFDSELASDFGDFGDLGGSFDIAGSAASVPEPLTWVQMLLGMGLIGAATRRRAGRAATC